MRTIRHLLATLTGIAILVFSIPVAVFAGGPISFNATELFAPSYQSYLGTLGGTVQVTFENLDSVAHTITGTGWQTTLIPAGSSGTYTFTTQGDFPYIIDTTPVLNGDITILNNPPSFPSGATLSAQSTGTASVSLSWPAATDDATGVHYKVYQGSTLVADTVQTSALSAGLQPATSYTFTVQAFDSGNLTSSTLTASATTASPTPTPSPSPKATPAPTATPVPTPVPTASPTPSPTIAAVVSASPSASPTPTIIATTAIASHSTPLWIWLLLALVVIALAVVGTLMYWRRNDRKVVSKNIEPEEKEDVSQEKD